MTPDREEALRLAREIEDGVPWKRGVSYDEAESLARALLALAADLEAAERERDEWQIRADERNVMLDEYRHDLASAREQRDRMQTRAEAAERERDEARDTKNLYKDRYQEAERDLATAREALERIADVNTDDPIRDAAEHRAIAHDALRSLGEGT